MHIEMNSSFSVVEKETLKNSSMEILFMHISICDSPLQLYFTKNQITFTNWINKAIKSVASYLVIISLPF